MADVPDQPHPLDPDEFAQIRASLQDKDTASRYAWITHRLVATVEAQATQLEGWEQRMYATVYERAAWQHDTGAHADSEHPYLHCPRCEMEHPEGMLADAHAVIRRYEAGWHSTKHVEGLWAKDSLRFEQWEPMTPGEAGAIRWARSVPATETGETP